MNHLWFAEDTCVSVPGISYHQRHMDVCFDCAAEN